MNLPAERGVLEHIHRAEHEQVHDRVVKTSLRRLAPVVAEVIRQGVAEGDLHVASADAAAALALAATMGMDDIGYPGGARGAGERAAALLEFVLRGLGYAGPLPDASGRYLSFGPREAPVVGESLPGLRGYLRRASSRRAPTTRAASTASNTMVPVPLAQFSQV